MGIHTHEYDVGCEQHHHIFLKIESSFRDSEGERKKTTDNCFFWVAKVFSLRFKLFCNVL